MASCINNYLVNPLIKSGKNAVQWVIKHPYKTITLLGIAYLTLDAARVAKEVSDRYQQILQDRMNFWNGVLKQSIEIKNKFLEEKKCLVESRDPTKPLCLSPLQALIPEISINNQFLQEYREKLEPRINALSIGIIEHETEITASLKILEECSQGMKEVESNCAGSTATLDTKTLFPGWLQLRLADVYLQTQNLFNELKRYLADR